MADFEDDVSSAAVLFLPFLLLFALLYWLDAPTLAERAASDPLIQLIDAAFGAWAVTLLSAVPAVGWILIKRPSREGLRRATQGALGAVLVVAVGLPLSRVVVGPTIPFFVPPEESAAPGMALGVGAGVIEEAVFRFGIAAAVFSTLRRRASHRWAIAAAVVASSVLFALSHELGPGAGMFEARFFVTRLIIPGCLMSLLFFWPGPAFLVTLHSAAHIGIPLLFVSAASGA